MAQDEKKETTEVEALPSIEVKIKETTEKLSMWEKEKDFELKCEKFLGILNKPPHKDKVKSRQSFSYLPISTIESQLDEMFLGHWEAKNFRWEQIANEIVGSCDLHVIHPLSHKEIVRVGAAAVQIRQLKGTPILEIGEHKIKDTLGMDFPHLLSECIKNAAKKLGEYFGRNLNRKFQDTYEPLFITMQAKIKSNLEELQNEANNGEEKK